MDVAVEDLVSVKVEMSISIVLSVVDFVVVVF